MSIFHLFFEGGPFKLPSHSFINPLTKMQINYIVQDAFDHKLSQPLSQPSFNHCV